MDTNQSRVSVLSCVFCVDGGIIGSSRGGLWALRGDNTRVDWSEEVCSAVAKSSKRVTITE